MFYLSPETWMHVTQMQRMLLHTGFGRRTGESGDAMFLVPVSCVCNLDTSFWWPDYATRNLGGELGSCAIHTAPMFTILILLAQQVCSKLCYIDYLLTYWLNVIMDVTSGCTWQWSAGRIGTSEERRRKLGWMLQLHARPRCSAVEVSRWRGSGRQRGTSNSSGGVTWW